MRLDRPFRHVRRAAPVLVAARAVAVAVRATSPGPVLCPVSPGGKARPNPRRRIVTADAFRTVSTFAAAVFMSAMLLGAATNFPVA